MNQKVLPWFSALIQIVLLSGCAAKLPFSGTAVLCGKVSDSDGRPVAGYMVCVNDFARSMTDSTGLFTVSGVPAGTCRITGRGTGWSPVDQSVEFTDRRAVVCIQVNSVQTVVHQVEDALRSGDTAHAQQLIDDAGIYNRDLPLMRFAQALVYYKKGEYQKACVYVNRLRKEYKAEPVFGSFYRLLCALEKGGR